MQPRSSALPNSTIGIDIGGANLKYADTTGRSRAVEYPLWLRPDDLADQIVQDLDSLCGQVREAAQVFATMTGELADCFLDRSEGVLHIADQLRRATQKCGLPDPLFYAVDGRFLSIDELAPNVDLVAAANWHALASFVATEIPTLRNEAGLLVDIGSTTTDLIPIAEGKVLTNSTTDYERLAEGSLVYLGGCRTPVCSIVQSLIHQGETVPVMREVFATIQDARILLNYDTPDASDCRTADGKPRDTFHSANRIARMIGLDHRSVSLDDAKLLAGQIHRRASKIITESIAKLESRFPGLSTNYPVVISGHCQDLLQQGPSGQTISLAGELGDQLSRVAPAYAVARQSAR